MKTSSVRQSVHRFKTYHFSPDSFNSVDRITQEQPALQLDPLNSTKAHPYTESWRVASGRSLLAADARPPSPRACEKFLFAILLDLRVSRPARPTRPPLDRNGSIDAAV